MNYLKFTLLLLAFILLQNNIYPTIHYVKAGNTTPLSPYTSWATASDSIQKCINVCVPGDTIYVGNGVYKEKLTLIHKLALIGSGWDSCVVDISDFPEPPDPDNAHTAINARDSCLIKNFKVQGNYSIHSGVLGWIAIQSKQSSLLNITSLKVENNLFFAFSTVFGINNGHFTNNVINYAYNGIIAIALPVAGLVRVDSNYMYNLWNQACEGDGNLILRNNIMHFESRGKVIGMFQSPFFSEVKNNIAFRTDQLPSLKSFDSDGDFRNNVLFLQSKSVFNLSSPVSKVINNVILEADTGVTISGSATPDNIRYNNFWRVDKKYNNFTIDTDTTNLSVDPMFVKVHKDFDTVPGDYHLQKYSPIIDKGDPAILDRDGTRSDMGIYGGPLGEIYEYRDYAPRPPQGIKLRYDAVLKTVLVRWEKATEADFSRYIVYIDTLSGFIPDSTRIFLSITDTSFAMNVSSYNRVYYKIYSVDKQGNISEAAPEVGVIITGVENEVITEEKYKLYPNYPNPFKGKTRIGYSIAKRSYVKITVYDIKGELVEYIENKERERGYYEVEFNAASRNESEIAGIEPLVSGIYLCKIDITDSETGHLVFCEMRKLVLVR